MPGKIKVEQNKIKMVFGFLLYCEKMYRLEEKRADIRFTKKKLKNMFCEKKEFCLTDTIWYQLLWRLQIAEEIPHIS